jgi:hypothetical protein
MSAIGDAKKKMTSSLLDIQFLDLQLVQENVARVETRETWEYTHTPVGSQSPEPLHVQAVVYKLSYRLGKNNNNWYVASVEVLAEEKNDKDLERKQIVTKGSQPATKRE